MSLVVTALDSPDVECFYDGGNVYWTGLQTDSTGKDLRERQSKPQEVLKMEELFSPGQRKRGLVS